MTTLSPPRVIAHLIVGARPEPFLPALLASLDGVVHGAIVDENSGLEHSENRALLEQSALFQRGEMQILRSSFTDFSTARNRCLAAHAAQSRADWVAFVDADEVHTPLARCIAKNLDRVPAHINFLDGYTYHFFQSFDWYMSIERRMSFHRFSPNLRWVGAVHEHLEGLPETRIALPYLYMHYGHVLALRRLAEKARQYSGLGADGDVVPESRLDAIDRESHFAEYWPKLLPFSGSHPQVATSVIAGLRSVLHEQYADTDRYVARHHQGVFGALSRRFWQYNYHLRWSSRRFSPIARRLCAP